jgi:hypothetical protein
MGVGIRFLVLVSAGLLVLQPAPASTAAAAPRSGDPAAALRMLADLGPGEATAVSAHGLVAGHTDGAPWTWRRGARTPPQTRGAGAWPEAVNSGGLVVGSVQVGDTRHAAWWRRGRLTLLPGLGGDHARATD